MISTGPMNKNLIYKATAVLLALILWQFISMFIDMEMLLASPLTVLNRLFNIIFEEDFLKTVLFSMGRITKGFLLAFSGGCILAVLAGRFKWIEMLLWPYIITIKAVPVASFIILCLIWFSYKQLTILIAFLIAFPVIYTNFLEGLKNTDKKLIEMADLYNVNWRRKLLYIYLPNVKPYLLSACSIAIGMAWKAGVAAEVIGVVDCSIGERLYESKIYFLNADLLSWTIVIILLSVLGEKLFQALIRLLFAGMEKL